MKEGDRQTDRLMAIRADCQKDRITGVAAKYFQASIKFKGFWHCNCTGKEWDMFLMEGGRKEDKIIIDEGGFCGF